MSFGTAGILRTFMLLPIHSVLGQFNSTSINSNSSVNTTNSSDQSVPYDPYLSYQPNFARSLPIQLLIAGIVLTLCTTLLIQLLFTWQYHWPLARTNWILQFTSVCTLLINVIAILYVVLKALAEKSKLWPYMFEYIAINVPRGSWSIAEVAAWCVMEATTSALATITHIQFLTCLYPSRLEARLVFFLLGPLAIVAFVMSLMPISTYSYSYYSGATSGFNITAFNDTISHLNSSHTKLSLIPTVLATNVTSDDDNSSRDQQLTDIFDSARNICNLTLSLLFTLSLLIWGFLVNRSNAWRTDGGTAAFGAGALGLALVSTGLNFINVLSHPRYEWLTSLLWSVVLWQSFLGWWWWVGSASGIASREIDMENRGRKEQKRAKRKRRKVSQTSGGEEEALVPLAARLERWRSSVGVTLTRRRPDTTAVFPSSQSQTSTLQEEAMELTTITSNMTVTDRSLHTIEDRGPPSTTSLTTSGSWYSNSTHFFSTVQRAWRSLRQAHVRAARVQAIEQRQIQIQMERENGRGLGRFPGGTGGERERSTLRNGSRPGASDEGGARDEAQKVEDAGMRSIARRSEEASGAMWWWGPLRKWRLRDSTVY